FVDDLVRNRLRAARTRSLFFEVVTTRSITRQIIFNRRNHERPHRIPTCALKVCLQESYAKSDVSSDKIDEIFQNWTNNSGDSIVLQPLILYKLSVNSNESNIINFAVYASQTQNRRRAKCASDKD